MLGESGVPLDVEREHGGGVLDLLDALVVRHLEDLLPVDLPDVVARLQARLLRRRRQRQDRLRRREVRHRWEVLAVGGGLHLHQGLPGPSD